MMSGSPEFAELQTTTGLLGLIPSSLRSSNFSEGSVSLVYLFYCFIYVKSVLPLSPHCTVQNSEVEDYPSFSTV